MTAAFLTYGIRETIYGKHKHTNTHINTTYQERITPTIYFDFLFGVIISMCGADGFFIFCVKMYRVLFLYICNVFFPSIPLHLKKVIYLQIKNNN